MSEKVQVIFCFSILRLGSPLVSVVAQGQVINLPSALGREVIALYQESWHLKSNSEYLSVGVLAIAHCDRLLKIYFMPPSAHMRIENYLQANDVRNEICIHIHAYIYICVCIKDCCLHQLNTSILSSNSTYFCHIEIRRDAVATAWRASSSFCHPRSNNEPLVISVMMGMSVVFISA